MYFNFTAMNRLKCAFFIILIYWLILYNIFLLNIRNKNFIEFFYSYDNLIDLKLSNNKPIKSFNSSKNWPNIQHYQNQRKLFHKFVNTSNTLHMIKISIKNVTDINYLSPEITQDSTYPSKSSHYKLYPAQTRKDFNVFKSMKNDNETQSIIIQNLTTIFPSTSNLTFNTKVFSFQNLTTIYNNKDYCRQYSNLVAMAMANKPLLHNYLNVSILMEPIIQAPTNGKSLFMLVGILSLSEDLDMRNAVRETWGSRSNLSSFKRLLSSAF